MKGLSSVFRKLSCFLIATVFINQSANSAVNIQSFGINPYHFGISDMWNLNLNNSSSSSNVYIKASLKSSSGKDIVQLITRPFTLKEGLTTLNSLSIQVASTSFSDKNIEEIERNTKSFPAGNYQLCYDVINATSNSIEGNQCEDIRLEVLTPPAGITPEDLSVLESIYPLFSWLPQIPSAGVSYIITISEVTEGQTPIDAILRNRPVHENSGISGLSYLYPQGAMKLEKGKNYAWQIKTYYKNQSIDNPNKPVPASLSPVYSFRIKNDSLIDVPFQMPYAILKKEGYTDKHLAYGALKFIYYENSAPSQLKISIKNSKGKALKLKETAFDTQLGENKYEIDLNSFSMNEKDEYYLEVVNSRGDVYKLPFVFRYAR